MPTLPRLVSVATFVILAFAAAGCATTAADRLRLVTASDRLATDVAALTFDPGRDYVVATRDGRTTRGRVTTSGGALVVTAPTLQPRVVPDDEIVLVGIVAGASRMRRGWIGAVVGAAVSLPFGISSKGDMVLPHSRCECRTA